MRCAVKSNKSILLKIENEKKTFMHLNRFGSVSSLGISFFRKRSQTMPTNPTRAAAVYMKNCDAKKSVMS